MHACVSGDRATLDKRSPDPMPQHFTGGDCDVLDFLYDIFPRLQLGISRFYQSIDEGRLPTHSNLPLVLHSSINGFDLVTVGGTLGSLYISSFQVTPVFGCNQLSRSSRSDWRGQTVERSIRAGKNLPQRWFQLLLSTRSVSKAMIWTELRLT